MDDLVEFLNARYDEAEKCERSHRTFKGWPPRDPCPKCGRPVAGDEFFKRYGESAADPFVLADIDSKRRIVELHPHTTMRQDVSEARLRLNYGPHWEKRLKHVDDLYCLRCHVEDGMIQGDDGRPCLHLRLLALPHTGHPDFKEKWRV